MRRDHDDRLCRLWEEHRRAPFPARCRGVDFEGVDLVMLDADVAGLVHRELDVGLDDEGVAILWAYIANLDKVLPLIGDAYGTTYYRKLRTLAGVAAARRMHGAI
ncbi:hypothetical protein SAMN04487981_101200 [Streptomyces sp. cf386]|uniref:hypothetical protein n=1 Tax=Streptomyces sp. cf386 TaxID=1761904 RepID=UPI00088E4732|nr:hypothetical protein [Streptomyces sp. cf386]SDM34283.1 hypothetical protein SAMN04487981_101200 [Streptomyces sp. cf386]